MRKELCKICATTTVTAVLLSASPIATPVAHAGWGSVIGGVIGGILNGGGGGSDDGNGGGAIGGLSNQQHAHPNPNNNEKLFMLAVEKNDIGTVSEMLNAGVDVNGVYPGTASARYTKGRTAFVTALSNNNRDIMQLLLENGADPSGFYTHDNKHISYLELIAHSTRDADLTQFLIDWGADVNGYTDKSNDDKVTPIYTCAASHRISQDAASVMAQLLIEHGAFLESKDYWGYTPFLKAVDMGSYRVIDVLADGGANLNAKNKQGKNALQIALDKNDLQLYKHVEDIMARGQQPSQYQPSKPQTSRQTNPANEKDEQSGDLVVFENESFNQNARRQEFNDFFDIVDKAIIAENKANKEFNEKMGKSPMTIEVRSAEGKRMLEAMNKIKASIEPQKLLPKINHFSPDEKEICGDLLQVMNTRYEKLISFHEYLSLERELSAEEQEKSWALFDDAKTLKQNINEILKRMSTMFKS